jgi:hypothetical protein
MEPGGSLPCSQELFAGPYSEPDQSNPISLRSILILFLPDYYLCLLFQDSWAQVKCVFFRT